MAVKLSEAQQEGFRNLLLTGEHSDLTLRCGDTLFKVHKAVICPQSKFFAKACKAEGFQESFQNQINLEIGDPATIQLLLEVLYFQSFKIIPISSRFDADDADSENYFITLIRLYIAADFYDAPSVKAGALENFKKRATAAFIVRNKTPDNSFIKAVEYFYAQCHIDIHPDSGVRRVIIDLIIENAQAFWDPNHLPGAELHPILLETEQLTKDFALFMSRDWKEWRKTSCELCGVRSVRREGDSVGDCIDCGVSSRDPWLS